MGPIYTSFYTEGTLYEREAARLRRSLQSLGLARDIRPIRSLGDWAANARYTATHILQMMDEYPDRPIVQLDADALVWRRPDLFEDGSLADYDLAGHYRAEHELLNGTLYIAPTAAARRVIEAYRDNVAAHPQDHNEQKWLQVAVEAAVSDKKNPLRFYRLEASYAWIHDIHVPDDLPDGQPVIEQLQASRESRGPADPGLPRRRQRLEKIGAATGA